MIHKISQVSLPWEGPGNPPSPPPPFVLLPRFGPSLTNPGYNTVTGLTSCAWGHNTHAHKTPPPQLPPPLDWTVKMVRGKKGIDILPNT